MSYFDNLIRDGRDADAMRHFARTYYDNGKIGHTRMMLLVRVADEHDALKTENALLRKVAEVAIEYLSDRHIVTTRDMEEALNNYEAWKETQK